jgi:hypothetical protein
MQAKLSKRIAAPINNVKAKLHKIQQDTRAPSTQCTSIPFNPSGRLSRDRAQLVLQADKSFTTKGILCLVSQCQTDVKQPSFYLP